MKKLILATIVLFSILPTLAQDISGTWGGTVDIQGDRLRMVFNVTQNEKGFSTTMDSPDQGVQGIPVESTRLKGSMITFEVHMAGISYEGFHKDSVIVGTYTQHNQDFPLTLTKKLAKEYVVSKPQEPKEPYPYISEKVIFKNGEAGISLAGTLTIPKGEGTFPVVILISGSGPQNRNEELMGHKPFLVLSDYLTRNGIAVLRYDDRGVGESTGNFRLATSADFATDVKSAITYLKTIPEIDSNSIGLLGHSEGGLIAPMVAAESMDVQYIVLMAGSGIRGDKLLLLQEELIERVLGTPEPEIKRMLQTNRKLFDAVVNSNDDKGLKSELRGILEGESEIKVPDGMTKEAYVAAQVDQFTSPWVTYFLRYDPMSNLGKVKCPVLAINGSKDLQVPSKENLSAIQSAVQRGGNTNVTIKEYKDLNHLFQESITGSPLEYSVIEETIAPIVLKEVMEWIKRQAN